MASAELIGWDRWSRRIDTLIINISKKTVPTIQKEGRRIHKEMVRDAPVLTGFLRDNIDIILQRLGVELHSKAPYSLWVDRGTSRMRPQSFFRNNLILGIRRLLRELKIVVVKTR